MTVDSYPIVLAKALCLSIARARRRGEKRPADISRRNANPNAAMRKNSKSLPAGSNPSKRVLTIRGMLSASDTPSLVCSAPNTQDGKTEQHTMIHTPHPGTIKEPQGAPMPQKGCTELPSWLGTLLDTGARRVQARSADAQARLAHASRVATLGEMSASIVHEVNQTLAVIAFNAEASLLWLTRANPNVAEGIAALRHVIEGVERASAVTGRIRALARNSNPVRSRLDINDLVAEVVAVIKQKARGQRVSVRFDRSPRLPAAHGDSVGLQQVVMNLLVNGIEAMDSLRDRPRELVIRTRRNDAHTVSVAVQDTGPGTDTDDLDQLFRAFYSTKSNGTGLGLAISRSIIEAHHGRIWARRNRGPGLTFQFTVPAHQPNATCPDLTQNRPPAAAKNRSSGLVRLAKTERPGTPAVGHAGPRPTDGTAISYEI